MDLLQDMRVMDGIYWEATVKDQNNQWSYELPQPMKCRWEDIITKETDQEGNDVVFTSCVFVDRPMKNHDKVMLGKMKDLTGALPPPAGAKEVRKIENTPILDVEETTPVLDSDEWCMEVYL